MSSQSHLDVVCLGMLVADMFASPLKEMPAAGELRVVDEIYPDTGGCAANTGVSLVKLGLKVGVIGKVGDDPFGDFIIHDMSAKGLDASGIRRSAAAPTSKTMIIPVMGQDRRFIHTLGANADLGFEDIDLDLVARARVLYVGGYLVVPKLDQDSLVKLFRFAKEHGLQTVLDVIVPAGGGAFNVSKDLARVLPHTDVFLPNDDEGRLLTGETDPVAQAKCFLSHSCSRVVITMGERGSVAASAGAMFRAATFRLPMVDPSGAGDAFDAGYIFGMLQGWDVVRTLTFASAIGASACTKLGCTPGVFTLPEANAFLQQNPLEIAAIN